MHNDNNSPLTVNTISREYIGLSMLERYTNSPPHLFQPYILLANFHSYVEAFANSCSSQIYLGPGMSVCHDPKSKISIINYGIGSSLAALIIELLSLIKPDAILALGHCGSLRDNYSIGEYFNPVAAIRDEGTSISYMPSRCPALSSFVIQRFVCEELERNKITYHSGVIHTTNVRFWEFKEDFKQKLAEERSQAIDMECATLFTVGFSCTVPVGALMIITDSPLKLSGIKTKESRESFLKTYGNSHLQVGINILLQMQKQKRSGFHYQF